MENFYTTTTEVEILAQADPTQQDFVLSPDMPHPGGLHNSIGRADFSEWNVPGTSSNSDLGCGDYLIDILPYSHIDSTTGAGDDWDVFFGEQ